MKLSARPLPRSFAFLPAIGLCLMLADAGCGFGRGNKRPASSLSTQDRTTLDDYEQIRVALATDDLRDAKAAAGSLVAALKPADAHAPAPATLSAAEEVADGFALDRTRQAFKKLSAKIIPLAQGVEGFYVMTCPLPSAGDWVQRTTDPDNPYLGKIMHGYGELKK